MDADTPPKLTSTQEDYLEIIFQLEREKGSARAKDIAAGLGVSRPTVTSALQGLAKRKLIDYEPYGVFRLTPAGTAVAKEIFHRHVVLREFFRNVLQLEIDVAEDAACRCEHALNPHVMQRLGEFLLYLERSGFQESDWRESYRELLRRSPHPGKPNAQRLSELVAHWHTDSQKTS